MAKQKARREFNCGGQARGCKAERVEDHKEKCHHYSIEQEIKIVEYTMVRMEEDLASMCLVAEEVGVDKSSLSRWMDKLPIYRHIAKYDQVRFAINPGHRGQLEDVGPDMLAFIEELREKGYTISRKMIVMQACKFLGSDSAFSLKSYVTKAQSVSRWMAKNDLWI